MYQIIILTIIASCVALPTDELKTEKRVKDCSNGILNPMCLKIGAITLIERLNKKDELSLLPGISLVKEASDKTKYETVAAELARSLTGTDEKLDKYLLSNVGNFLDTHSVKFRLLDESSVEEVNSAMGEGRGKSPLGGGKKGGLGGIMAMAMMMKGESFLSFLKTARHSSFLR